MMSSACKFVHPTGGGQYRQEIVVANHNLCGEMKVVTSSAKITTQFLIVPMFVIFKFITDSVLISLKREASSSEMH